MSADKKEIQKRRLINWTMAEESLGNARGLVATTFDLNPSFFETDYLPSVLGLGAWDDRTWTSRIALERQLALMESVTIFAEAGRYQGRPRSLRVEHVPVSPGAGRRLHAKVTLIVYEKGCRVVVASANLTEQGYRANRECAAVFTVTDEDRGDAHILNEAIAGLRREMGPWWTEGAERVAEAAEQFIGQAQIDEDIDTRFAWSGGKASLLDDFLQATPSEPIQELTIVSPFWSEGAESRFLEAFLGKLKSRDLIGEDMKLSFLTEAKHDGEDDFLPILPPGFGAFDFGAYGIKATAQGVDPSVLPEEIDFKSDFVGKRPLHAKTLIARGTGGATVYLGSANFTRRGWSIDLPASKANIEAGIIVRLDRGDARVDSLIPKGVGPKVALTGDGEAPIAEPADAEADQPWPSFIQRAALTPSMNEKDALELIIEVDQQTESTPWSASLPSHQDEDPTGELLKVDSNDQSVHRVELNEALFRQLLKEQEILIKWPSNTTGRAIPLNVDIAAREGLPLAPRVGAPREQHLIAYYQGRIAWEDLFPDPDDPQGQIDLERDTAPDSGVDTSGIQSYQIREFVEALTGIRHDLQSAMGSPAAMRLALFGPVSPTQLAKVIESSVRDGVRTPTGGAFQLVEILQCVLSIDEQAVAPQNISAWRELRDKATVEIRERLSRIRYEHPEMFSNDSPFHEYESKVLGIYGREANS